MGPKDNVILYARDVYKEYKVGKNILRVLNGINLEVTEGEILIIIGPSGAGKSTLLHILGILDSPSSGAVIYRGKNLSELSPRQQAEMRNRYFGFIFQFYHLLPDFTALENVMMPGLIGHALPNWRNVKKASMARAAELLGLVGLGPRAPHRPDQLSGGERQRVAIARALMNEPRIVFCDEPTGNLDTENSLEIQKLILKLNETKGQTFVIVTHDEDFAKIGKRRVRIADGIIVG
ncbi:MAG TPA: ABC transporter ATP-binding protein [Candidatus Hypogeohydataceae bacterium YC38]